MFYRVEFQDAFVNFKYLGTFDYFCNYESDMKALSKPFQLICILDHDNKCIHPLDLHHTYPSTSSQRISNQDPCLE